MKKIVFIYLATFFLLINFAGLLFAAAEGDGENVPYKVGPSDVLTITVYDNPDLSGNFTVSSEGYIVFPLVGQVKVANSSILEIKERITYLLEKDYLYNPVVSVSVEQYKSKQVKILGNVQKPGIYYLKRPTRLFDLLSMAEGVSMHLGTIMKGLKARIVRQAGNAELSNSGTLQTIYVDLHDLLIAGDEAANIPLKDGDIIYIPESQKVYVVGGVKAPGKFPYEEGLTVLKAISMAGGIDEKSVVLSTTIKRVNNGEESKISADAGDILLPEDIVEVVTEIKQVHVVGEVLKPGTYSYEDRMTVLQAISRAGGVTKKASPKNTVIKRIANGKEVEIETDMSDTLRPNDVVEVPLSFW